MHAVLPDAAVDTIVSSQAFWMHAVLPDGAVDTIVSSQAFWMHTTGRSS